MLLPKPGYNLSKNRDNFYLVVTCYRGGLKPPPGNNFEQQTLLVTGNNLVTRGNNLAKTGQIAKWEEAGMTFPHLAALPTMPQMTTGRHRTRVNTGRQ